MSIDRTRRTHRSTTRSNRVTRSLLDALESRMMLSGDLQAGAPIENFQPGSVIRAEWEGRRFDAKQGQWVLHFNDALGNEVARTTALAIAAELGVTVENAYSIGRGRYAALHTSRVITEAAVDRAMERFPVLVSMEPDAVYQPDAVPNDPFYSNQWWLNNTGQFGGTAGADIDAQRAWDITYGSETVIVGVIDTGVQIDHPDLAANIWTNPGEIAGNNIDDDGNGFTDDVHGWDFGELDNDPDDVYGHGTPVAGMIAADSNNGVGVAGVSWNTKILPLKIADRFLNLTLAGIIGAFDYATMMIGRGHNIVATNNSYGGVSEEFYADAPTGFDAERDAIERFVATGAAAVCSAGNGGADGIGDDNDASLTAYPASYNIAGVISVAATDLNDTIAVYSNYGAERVDLGAPGPGTYTTAIGSGYTYFGGTSAAAPATTGVVALLKSLRPNSSATEIRQALIDSCDPVPSLQGKVVSGGRLNAYRALQIIGLSGPVLRSVNPGPVTSPIDSSTGQAIRSVRTTFNKSMDANSLSTAAVSLRGDGADNIFGTADDRIVPISAVALSVTDDKSVVITLNLSNGAQFPQQRLPIDRYQLVLDDSGFRDTNGNYLNGNAVAGEDTAYIFNVVSASNDNEPNDTTATATAVVFNASGQAAFAGAFLGNGIQPTLDVDIYRIDMARGGLIKAEIIAKRLPTASTLDSVIRLFNASGQQLALNDQYFGQDSYLDFFVTTGGTYYIGVSGFGNSNYSPSAAGSGSTQSIGSYNLNLAVQLTADDQLSGSSTLTSGLRIPATGSLGVITNTIQIADSRQILDLNVRINLTHEFDEDLVITLTSPAGAQVTLSNRRGGNGQNFQVTYFDDEAVTPISLGSAPFNGTFQPDGALSLFDGQSALGGWTLTIDDRSSLHTGSLLSWSLDFTLSNNIFGPFESNDTLVTAFDVTTISANGFGTGTIGGAFVGDGGFGLFDRDIFKFTVGAGSTLSVNVTSTSTLNTTLRLFNANGTQLLLSSPSDSLNSLISTYGFVDGGTYYLAVSEGQNTGYDPFVVTSGNAAATTGTYSMNISVVRGVSDARLTADGNIIRAGMSIAGTLLSGPGEVSGAGNGRVGIRWNGIETLFSSSNNQALPRQFFGASASGVGYINQDQVTQQGPVQTAGLPVAISDESDAVNRRVVVRGLFGDLRVERSFSFGINDSFIAFDVTLTNLGASRLTGVSWMEAFNPDMGLNLFPTLSNTVNDLDDTRPMASARFVNNNFPGGLTFALAAPATDSRAVVNVIDSTQVIRDSNQLLSLLRNDPNGANDDSTLSIAFNLGDLDAAGNANNSVSLRYFIFLGSSAADVETMYGKVNDGTGTGHLAATPSAAATETLSDGSTVAQLPYRVYYPEGYANAQTSTFVPIMNTSNQANRIIVIARYEGGVRDQVISQFTLEAGSRGGITITTPDLYAAGTLLVRKDEPYALEIRSEAPVAATFSHYDEFILSGSRAGVGEAFTTQVDSVWSFGEALRGDDVNDFILFMNTTDETIKIVTTFYPLNSGGLGSQGTYVYTQFVDPYRRSGWAMNFLGTDDNGRNIPAGSYGVRLVADGTVVAALSHYDKANASAAGLVGQPGEGSTSGVIPDGQLGLGSTREVIGILNPNGGTAEITLSFILTGGSTYRTSVSVPPRAQSLVDVGALAQFPTGQAYSVLFESSLPVSVTESSLAYGEGTATSFSNRAFTMWGFGEGFRPAGEAEFVSERLRLFNPSVADTLVEITVRYEAGFGQEIFRVVVPARRSTVINTDELITGVRRENFVFYGITVKAASPIVASMDHYDPYFPGAFATLGTPLGVSQLIS